MMSRYEKTCRVIAAVIMLAAAITVVTAWPVHHWAAAAGCLWLAWGFLPSRRRSRAR